MSNVDDDMDKPVTKRELYEVLGIWGGALEARIEARIEARFDVKVGALGARIDAWGSQLSAELAQHTNRILEECRSMIRIIDDKYEPRVSKLEAKVFAPKRQRSPRRRAR